MSAKTGDRVRAHHFNFDGRWNDYEAGIFTPDIPDVGAILIGTLTVQDDNSIWGERSTCYVTLDSGAVRQVEPDTIELLSEGNNG